LQQLSGHVQSFAQFIYPDKYSYTQLSTGEPGNDNQSRAGLDNQRIPQVRARSSL
jgi:hypothetical protein